MQAEIIQKAEKLQEFCTQIAKQEWLALDTEFIRENTYYPNLCLIQIACDERAACIDTLAIDDLSPLKELIFSDNITIIFHAASQDLEILFNLYKEIPTPIFDTQIAASALGYGEQVSYAHLVSKICGVTLDKSLSRTTWDRRPLSDKEIQYALDDVRYLTKIYPHLKNELENQERDHWLTDEFNRMCAKKRYEINLDELWKSIKGAGKLAPYQLIVLKQLAAWREQQAIQKNKPRTWILRDKILRILAIEQPDNFSALSTMEILTHQQLQDYADVLLECIRLGQQTQEQEWPDSSLTMPLNREQRKIMKQALQFVRERAEQLNIAPSLLATRSTIEKLLRGRRDLQILQSWRKELIGNDLVQLLEIGSKVDS